MCNNATNWWINIRKGRRSRTGGWDNQASLNSPSKYEAAPCTAPSSKGPRLRDKELFVIRLVKSSKASQGSLTAERPSSRFRRGRGRRRKHLTGPWCCLGRLQQTGRRAPGCSIRNVQEDLVHRELHARPGNQSDQGSHARLSSLEDPVLVVLEGLWRRYAY